MARDCCPLYVAMSRARKERTSVFASGLRIECDFLFARFAERPVFPRPDLWCMIFIYCERHGVIEPTEARSWGKLIMVKKRETKVAELRDQTAASRRDFVKAGAAAGL